MPRRRQTAAIAARLLRRDDRAGGIGGAGEDQAVRRGVEPFDRGGGDLEPLRLAAADLDRLEMQRLHRVAIGDIARPGERHPLAGREQAGQRQHQRGRGTAGEDHLLGIDRRTLRLGIVARDPRLQRAALPIAHRIIVEHAMRRRDRGLRRAGGGLAELHVDHRTPLRSEAVRGTADGDGVERIDDSGHADGLAAPCPTFQISGEAPGGAVRDMQPELAAAPQYVLGGPRPFMRDEIIHLTHGQPAADVLAEIGRCRRIAEQRVDPRAVSVSETAQQRGRQARPLPPDPRDEGVEIGPGMSPPGNAAPAVHAGPASGR